VYSTRTEVVWVLTSSDLVGAYILKEHAAPVFRGTGLGQSLTLALQYVGLPPVCTSIRLQTRRACYVGVCLLVYPSLSLLVLRKICVASAPRTTQYVVLENCSMHSAPRVAQVLTLLPIDLQGLACLYVVCSTDGCVVLC
jgi:hypothetical protein